MNPIFSGFQKMDIEHYSTQPTPWLLIPIIYGPSLLYAEFAKSRVCMGRVCYVPSLLWAVD